MKSDGVRAIRQDQCHGGELIQDLDEENAALNRRACALAGYATVLAAVIQAAGLFPWHKVDTFVMEGSS
jgi:hypothetical protein